MFSPVHLFSSFAVKDLKQARNFYSETLGLKVSEDKDMGLLELKLDGKNRIMIYPKDDHRPATYTVLNLVVKNIDDAVEELDKRGVSFEKYEGFEQEASGIARANEYGPSIAWFKDPSGNILAVLEDKEI